MIRISLQTAISPVIIVTIFLGSPMAAVSRASEPYCGVYSLYGAARSFGIDVDLPELITPQYISSSRGSSSEDLRSAAASVGLTATPLFGLGRHSLVHADTPLILHVSPNGVTGTYTHWLLFLGIENDNAIVYDGPGGFVPCTIESILARWDGNAIAITKASSAPTSYLFSEIGHAACLLLLIVISLALTNRVFEARASKFIQHGIVQCSIIGLMAISFTVITYAINRSGPNAMHARASIDSASGLTNYSTVDTTQLNNLMLQGDIVLVDCRYNQDYSAGTIPSALSLPLDAGMGYVKTFADRIDGKRVVLFCQSDSCHFSDYTATILTAEGIQDIQIFRGGYNEWRFFSEKHSSTAQ